MSTIIKYSFLFILFVQYTTVGAQHSPVSWSFEINQMDDGKYQFSADASIEKNWYIYSTKPSEFGPIPTSIEFTQNVEVVEEIKENSDKITAYDAMFDMEVTKYKHKANFTQVILPKNGVKTINGYLIYMACDASKCLPPEKVEFSISI